MSHWYTDKRGIGVTNNHRKEMAYLSGGMSGVDNHKAMFNEIAAELRRRGYAGCNPVETSKQLGPLSHSEYLRFDIQRVMEADIVYVIPGWTDSVGSVGEVHMAQLIGVPVINYATGEELPRIDFHNYLREKA